MMLMLDLMVGAILILAAMAAVIMVAIGVVWWELGR